MSERLAMLALVLAACSSPDRGPAWRAAGHAVPESGGTLHLAVKDPINTLDPTIEYDEVSSVPVHALFDTLLDYAPAGAPDPLALVPHLAARWTRSPDGMELHFWLRAGIVYSDGTPIVAGDFAYSLERALTTPDSPFQTMLVDVAGADAVIAGRAARCAGITVPNPRELVIRLAHPDLAFPDVLAMSFATPQRADHVAGAGDQLRREPLGSGPFVLAAWREGDRLVLRRNPRYWDAAHVYLSAIEIRENVPRDTQFLLFERGELDAADRLAAPDYLWIVGQPAWAPYVHRRLAMTAYGSRMNVRRPPFDDVRVRQALNYALDKTHVVKLLNGAAVPAHGILPPGVLGRDDTLAPYPHDPAKARALLAAAGYPFGFETDYVTINDPAAERLAASLQHDLAEVGVTVHVTELSLAAFGTVMGRSDGPAFSLAAWGADYPDPSNFIDVNFDSRTISAENSTNNTFYANPALDALLDAARGEADPGKRAALYRRAERILYRDAPWIWGYHEVMTEVVQPYVRGYAPHPIWLRDYAHAWLDLGPGGERVPR